MKRQPLNTSCCKWLAYVQGQCTEQSISSFICAYMKFINLPPCLFVIFTQSFDLEGARSAAVLDCGRKGSWWKNAVYQDRFLGIRFIPFCGCSLQRYVGLDWCKRRVCFDKLWVEDTRAPTPFKWTFNLFINITLLQFLTGFLCHLLTHVPSENVW